MLEKLLELMSNPRISVTAIMAIIAVTLILPMYRNGAQTRDKKKRLRRKVKARVTDIDRRMMTKEDGEVWIKYVFTVDGKEYTGSGTYLLGEYQLFKTATVFYDPDDPTRNCTNLMRGRMGTGGSGVLALYYRLYRDSDVPLYMMI